MTDSTAFAGESSGMTRTRYRPTICASGCRRGLLRKGFRVPIGRQTIRFVRPRGMRPNGLRRAVRATLFRSFDFSVAGKEALVILSYLVSGGDVWRSCASPVCRRSFRTCFFEVMPYRFPPIPIPSQVWGLIGRRQSSAT
jgi:hypothetical protein